MYCDDECDEVRFLSLTCIGKLLRVINEPAYTAPLEDRGFLACIKALLKNAKANEGSAIDPEVVRTLESIGYFMQVRVCFSWLIGLSLWLLL
jgi:hypothetical protein